MMLVAFLTISVVFGILRFVLPVEGKIEKADIYKDLAHIWVGILFGYAFAIGDLEWWLLPIGLTVLEVVAFVIRRKHDPNLS